MGSCVSHSINKKHPQPQPQPQPSVGPHLQDKPPLTHFGSKDETFFDTQPWLDSDCDDDFYSVNGDFTPSRGNTPVHHVFSTGMTPLVRTQSRRNTPTHPNFHIGAPHFQKTLSASSHTNTPVHNNFAAGTPHSNKVVPENELNGYNPEFSPTDKKKRLSELFRQSRGGYGDENIFGDNISADTKASVNSSPFTSGTSSVCSSMSASNGNIKHKRNKALKSAHPSCCLPKFLSVRLKDEKMMDVSSI